ncbi:MAG: T9SS C-terminal target domain-containing protein, partial [Bacteroidetes bacterium]
RPNHPDEFAVATSSGISTGTYSDVAVEFQTSVRNLTTSQFSSVAIGPFGNWVMGGGNRVGNELFNVIELNSPTEGYWAPSSPYWTGTFCEWSQLQPATVIFSGTDFVPLEPYIRSQDFGLTPALSFLGTLSSTLTQYLPSALWETISFPYSQDTVWIHALHGTIQADSVVIVESRNCSDCSFYYTVPVTIPEGDSLPVLDPFHARFFIYGTAVGRTGIYMSQDAIKFSKVPVFYEVAETAADIPTSLSLSGDLNYLWAGTTTGKIYRLSNLTLALDSITASVLSDYCIVAKDVFEFPEMAGRYITNVTVDPTNDNNVMVTLGNYGNDKYVYITENALDSLPTFVSAQGNLPAMPVYDGIFELHGSGIAILGTDMGVFTTQDVFAGAPQWAPDLEGMGDLPVTDLKQQTLVHPYQQNVGYIAAASYGRGLYYDTTYYVPVGIDPDPGSGTAAYATLQIHPNPVRQTTNVTYTLPETMAVTAYLYDLSGRLMTTCSFGKQLRGIHTSLLDLGSLSAGTYIVRINQAYGKIIKTN